MRVFGLEASISRCLTNFHFLLLKQSVQEFALGQAPNSVHRPIANSSMIQNLLGSKVLLAQFLLLLRLFWQSVVCWLRGRTPNQTPQCESEICNEIIFQIRTNLVNFHEKNRSWCIKVLILSRHKNLPRYKSSIPIEGIIQGYHCHQMILMDPIMYICDTKGKHFTQKMALICLIFINHDAKKKLYKNVINLFEDEQPSMLQVWSR